MQTEIATDTATSPRPRPVLQEHLGDDVRVEPASTVMVVDDDEAIRSVLAELLEMLGYRVSVAADGQEAADLLELGPLPTAILLDLMMPRMDGWTFLSRLRADPKYQDVPVVVASAVVHETPRGADALLEKPFEVRDLHRAIARFCAH